MKHTSPIQSKNLKFSFLGCYIQHIRLAYLYFVGSASVPTVAYEIE